MKNKELEALGILLTAIFGKSSIIKAIDVDFSEPDFDIPVPEKEVRYRTLNIIKEKVVATLYDGTLLRGRVNAGKVTVATLPLNDELTEFAIGFSFCSPRDIFDRKFGQEEALKDLQEVGDTFKRDRNTPVNECLKYVILKTAKEIGISWMKKVNVEDIF